MWFVIEYRHREKHTHTYIMSFINIKDPRKRDAIVAEYLATVKRLQNRDITERAHELTRTEEINRVLEPVVRSTAKSTEAITKELIPIREEMQVLNDRIAQPKLEKEEDDQQQQQQHHFSIKECQRKISIKILESFQMVNIITKWGKNVYKLTARIFSLMVQDTMVPKVYGL